MVAINSTSESLIEGNVCDDCPRYYREFGKGTYTVATLWSQGEDCYHHMHIYTEVLALKNRVMHCHSYFMYNYVYVRTCV